ncbi:uncharacterized protein J3D65DRAFT_660604 [Phyllosticta citribraziliensis]|uniref:Uncharacterized protein n=1 Tax=Phyllosticta citribraziliensis TaxID=989973 RepID=A0ABR1LI86_9PEZI
MDFHQEAHHQQAAPVVTEEYVLSSSERQRMIAAHPDWERDGYAEFDGLHDTINKVGVVIEEEIEIFENHFKTIVGPTISILINATFALTQQFVACNPRLWKAIVSLRKDGQYRLIWYPTPIFTQHKRISSFLTSGDLLDQGHFSSCVHALVQLHADWMMETMPAFRKRLQEVKDRDGMTEEDYCTHDYCCEILDKTDRITTMRETGHVEFLHANSPWKIHPEACGHVMHLVLLAITDKAQGTLEGTNVGPTYAELKKSLACFSIPKSLAGERFIDDEYYPSPLSRHLTNVGPLGDAVMGRLSWDAAPVQRIVRQAFADDQTEWNKYVANIESRLQRSFEICLEDLKDADRDHYGKDCSPPSRLRQASAQ